MRLIDADALIEKCGKWYTEEGPEEGFIGTLESLLNEQPSVGCWISVKDRLPKSGKHVLVTCEVRCLDGHKRKYVCVGYYAEQYKISAYDVADDICYDYNEEQDEYYLKEGWYEVIHNWDEYSSVVIADFVTHWMPFPEPQKEEP